MSVSFRILPARGLVFVRYDGIIRFSETAEILGQYASHPDMRPGQKQLVDLARVTGMDQDFATLMEIQAKKADLFLGSGHDVIFVYHAPTQQTRTIAHTVLRSWEDVPGVVPLVQATESGALHVLGQPEDTFDELLQNA